MLAVQNSNTLIYIRNLYFTFDALGKCVTFKDIFQDFTGPGILLKKIQDFPAGV